MSATDLQVVPPIVDGAEDPESEDGVQTGAEPLGPGAVDGDEPEQAKAEEPKPPKPMQIPLPGDFSGLNDVAGGAQPTSSEARLLGGSLPIEGQFAGEEIVTLIVEAKVSEVHVVYTTDDWGQTKAVKRRHRMRAISVRRFEQ